jgi:hypothetical protein
MDGKSADPGGLLDIVMGSVRAFTVGDLFDAVGHAPPKLSKRYVVQGIED